MQQNHTLLKLLLRKGCKFSFTSKFGVTNEMRLCVTNMAENQSQLMVEFIKKIQLLSQQMTEVINNTTAYNLRQKIQCDENIIKLTHKAQSDYDLIENNQERRLLDQERKLQDYADEKFETDINHKQEIKNLTTDLTREKEVTHYQEKELRKTEIRKTERYTCGCGKTLKHTSKIKHEQSAYHMKWSSTI